MATITIPKKELKITEELKAGDIKGLRIKAVILDELLEFIEDKYFGYLMKLTEKEPTIPLSKAKRLVR